MPLHGPLGAKVLEAPFTHPKLAIASVVFGREGGAVPGREGGADTEVQALDLRALLLHPEQGLWKGSSQFGRLNENLDHENHH